MSVLKHVQFEPTVFSQLNYDDETNSTCTIKTQQFKASVQNHRVTRFHVS